MGVFQGTSRLLRSIPGRTFHDQRRGLLGWGLAFASFALLMSAVYPSFAGQAEQIEELANAYPEGLKAFLGGLDDLGTPAGFLRAELFSTMFPIMLLVYAIGRAADTMAGEEERGSLDVLLSQPVSRRRVLLGKSAGIGAGVFLLATVSWASLALGTLAFGIDLGLARLAGACLALALLGLFFAALALALSAVRGRKAFAVGVSAGVAAVSYLANGLARLTDVLEPVRYASPFYYYEKSDALTGAPDVLALFMLAGATAVLIVVALFAFERRDIGV